MENYSSGTGEKVSEKAESRNNTREKIGGHFGGNEDKGMNETGGQERVKV